MRAADTGYPLYVVGSSTFGTKGGYLMPGLLMGLLQVGLVLREHLVSTTFILIGFGSKAGPGSLPFVAVAAIWTYALAYVGVKGIQYVAKFSLYLNMIPLLMILVVFSRTASGVTQFVPSDPQPYIGFMLLIQIVIGFFATAGAAGADFGMNNRDARDVRWGGLVGVALAILVAGGLPLLSVAGARVLYGVQGFKFDAVISGMGGFLATAMFFLFAIASIPPGLLLRLHRGQQLLDHDSRACPGFGSTMVGATIAPDPGGHRRGRATWSALHHHRRVLRPHLRSDDGRLSAFRQEVGRTARGHQLGRVYRLGGRLRGRHPSCRSPRT